MKRGVKHGGRSAFKACLLGSAILIGLATGSSAATATNFGEIYAGRDALPAAALDEMRGGLRVGSYDFDIGVRIRSIIEGQMELLSELRLVRPGKWRPTELLGSFFDTGEGPATSASSSGNGGEKFSIVPNLSLQIGPSQGGQSAGSSAHGVAPTVNTFKNGLEIALGSPETSQIIHQISNGHLTTIINNRMDGQTIDNSTQFDIGVTDVSNITSRLVPALRLGSISRRAFKHF